MCCWNWRDGTERLLDEIAATATAALKEMAQWQSSGHAYAAQTLLERIATKP